MSVSTLVLHGSMTLGCTSVEPMEVKCSSVCRFLALSNIEVLKKPEQYWSCTMAAVEVRKLKRSLEVFFPTQYPRTWRVSTAKYIDNICRII